MPRTLFEKLWDQHKVARLPDGSELIYIDRIFLHERTGCIALNGLQETGRELKNPKQVFCTMDHIIDTFPGRSDKTLMPGGTEFITKTREAAKFFNIRLFDINDHDQGISHVVSAEQGITLPGLTVVCPDSHTCTLGALGALAWGIGTSDCEHALSTETLRVDKPKQMRVCFEGSLKPGVSSKDMIMYLIKKYGATGGLGMAIEFCGPVIAQLSMEGRFTLCNMTTEFSGFTALISPDNTTFEYLAGRTYTPKGRQWQQATKDWKMLFSDENAVFDTELTINCSEISPMVSWGTSPAQSVFISDCIPVLQDAAKQNAAHYMNLTSEQSLINVPIQAAFIGSCTNGRLSDLQAAAEILKGHKVNPNVKAVCTPGSAKVKLEAEKMGLHTIFIAAGFEWREPGCSLCFYAGGEGFSDGQRIISTTNRNFEGRQGRGARTHIASPMMVAAAAIEGKIVDCRKYLRT
jgi:3-isopropylmalate/(R)-2-methylmalate dehydratase large subunit